MVSRESCDIKSKKVSLYMVKFVLEIKPILFPRKQNNYYNITILLARSLMQSNFMLLQFIMCFRKCKTVEGRIFNFKQWLRHYFFLNVRVYPKTC